MARAEIVLELSGKEAGVLLKVLENIGGNPQGPRGAIDSISSALKRLGIVATVSGSGGFRLDDRWD